MHGYPFSDISEIAISSRKIPVRVSGGGQPILFLHGYPLDSRMWNRVVPLLSPEYLCIAPDLRGFGRSAEESKSFSIAQLAQDCVQLLDALQIRQRVVVCGLSMGGYVAMEIAHREPKRVAGLVLANTRANADDAAGVAARRSVARLALTEGVAKAVLPMLAKLLSEQTCTNQPDVVTHVQAMMVETRPSTIAWAQMAMAGRDDFRQRMRDWKMPAVCIAGADDSITPPTTVQQMADAISKSTMHTVANASHLTPLESPDEFAKIVIEFLQSFK